MIPSTRVYVDVGKDTTNANKNLKFTQQDSNNVTFHNANDVKQLLDSLQFGPRSCDGDLGGEEIRKIAEMMEFIKGSACWAIYKAGDIHLDHLKMIPEREALCRIVLPSPPGVCSTCLVPTSRPYALSAVQDIDRSLDRNAEWKQYINQARRLQDQLFDAVKEYNLRISRIYHDAIITYIETVTTIYQTFMKSTYQVTGRVLGCIDDLPKPTGPRSILNADEVMKLALDVEDVTGTMVWPCGDAKTTLDHLISKLESTTFPSVDKTDVRLRQRQRAGEVERLDVDRQEYARRVQHNNDIRRNAAKQQGIDIVAIAREDAALATVRENLEQREKALEASKADSRRDDELLELSRKQGKLPSVASRARDLLSTLSERTVETVHKTCQLEHTTLSAICTLVKEHVHGVQVSGIYRLEQETAKVERLKDEFQQVSGPIVQELNIWAQHVPIPSNVALLISKRYQLKTQISCDVLSKERCQRIQATQNSVKEWVKSL